MKFLRQILFSFAFFLLATSTFVALGGSIENDALPMAPKRYDELDELPKNVFTSLDGRDPVEGRWGDGQAATHTLASPQGVSNFKQAQKAKDGTKQGVRGHSPVKTMQGRNSQINSSTSKSHRVPASNKKSLPKKK